MRLFSQLMMLTLLSAFLPNPAWATEAVREAVARLQPNATPQIKPSPIPGISEVSIGLQVLYVSDDGNYALGGPLLDLADGTNLTERRLSFARAKILNEASDIRRFHYPAEQMRYKVTVFTDIDCPHCRRFHTEVPSMQAAGIDIEYVLLPRAGKGSPSYYKSVNAACADDPEATITAAMAGQQPDAATCEHPVDEHLALSRRMNVASTPSIVLEDGQLVLGYHTATALLRVIEQRLGKVD